MKTKLLSLLLSVLLLASLTVPALAASGMDAFSAAGWAELPEKSSFSDVAPGVWYAPTVERCRMLGFMNGHNGKFDPNGPLKVSEALTIAARVHQIYQTGRCTLENGSPVWYQTYVDYCLKNGLCTEGMFLSWEDNITRNQMAYVFSRVVPDYELGILNEDLTGFIDMDTPTLYKEEVLRLYQAGVLTGSGPFGRFSALTSITRAEAAAIITRVALPSMRRSIHLLEPLEFAHQNAVVLALPQGYEYTSKSYETVFSHAGLGMFCYVTVTPDVAFPQISGFMTHDDQEEQTRYLLELNGDKLNHPLHTETFWYNDAEVCMTFCDVERSDGVSTYPMDIVVIKFVIGGELYEMEYQYLRNDAYNDSYRSTLDTLFRDMVDNLMIDGTTLRALES